jgi:type IV pilus assembly protein PilQ
MKKILILFGVIGLTAALFYGLQAQENFKTLDSIKIDGNSVVMTLSGLTKHHVFQIANPPRLVVEFTNVEHNVKNKEMDGNAGLIKRIRSGQFENEPVKIARVVIDLSKMTEYSLKDDGNNVILALNPDKQAKAPDVAANAAQKMPADAGSTVVATPYEGNQVEAAAKIIPEKKAPAPPAAKPAARNASGNNVVLPKKPITLDFEDADISDVLRVLSMKSGINIIHGSDVTGTITLHLENVPFNRAFETILSIKGLVSQDQGPNILRITTPQAIALERSQAVTFTKIFPLNYAKADEVKSNLDQIRNAEGRRGNISVDARTNSLIVTDTPEGLTTMEAIISELDKIPQQVIIETKIVEVTLTNDLDLGIDWALAGNAQTNPTVSVGQTTSGGVQSYGFNPPAGQSYTNVKVAGGGTGVSFPAASVSGMMSGISFAVVSNNTSISAQLTALAQKGLSKILSTPKVTTINNKEAKILVGQKIPYTTTTVTPVGSTQSTQFLDVGIKLTVTPTINVDEKITLAVHPEVSLYVRADAAGPVIGTREAQTTVMVNNGETVVIGGLITEQDIKNGTGVPLLGDLPIIGHLFKRDYSSKSRTELLVFLTPTIIK